MSEHTPGPWTVFNGYSNVFPDDGDTEARRHIAEITPEGCESKDCDITWTEHKANARLIAAAPDLLEALEEVQKADDEGYAPDRTMIDTAIAKARGEQ